MVRHRDRAKKVTPRPPKQRTRHATVRVDPALSEVARRKTGTAR
jgi:hypothetical protein